MKTNFDRVYTRKIFLEITRGARERRAEDQGECSRPAKPGYTYVSWPNPLIRTGQLPLELRGSLDRPQR